jgi:hypothetical protein
MDSTVDTEVIPEVSRLEVICAYQDLMALFETVDSKMLEMIDLLDLGPDVSHYTGFNRYGLSKRLTAIHRAISDTQSRM